MAKLKSAYLDSNVFIYASLYSGEVAEKSKEYLRKAADGEFNAYTSALTWDEVIYVVRKVAGFEESIRAGRILLKMPFLEFLDVDYAICEDAQKLVEKYKLLPRDAIHSALALKYCDGVIISNDVDFDVVEGLKRVFD
ncbi:MAG: type II toxin-antitoxin system VapC family toxin [Archaeoglobus sp.]|uniref:type II toxin-antitoxin system VapC family toxin n=1 Tax=Archaeoglobus sp. TaxID=1872626 RepID=UPI001D42065D|nr:type II toxin-antitoxin system VapC family toxin [Archaeoglobus sp.]MBO8180205.1 type II toxin-antitoxin system VapC family toxin [Archaeoglobus sp.]